MGRREVVGPQHPQVVLDQFGPLLLDEDGPGLEHVVVRPVELLHARLDRFRLDAGLGRIVDATRQVAVGVDGRRLAQPIGDAEQASENRHQRGSLIMVREHLHPTHVPARGSAGCRWPAAACCRPSAPVTASCVVATAVARPGRSGGGRRGSPSAGPADGQTGARGSGMGTSMCAATTRRPAPTAASSDACPGPGSSGRVIYRYGPEGRTGWFPGRGPRGPTNAVG